MYNEQIKKIRTELDLSIAKLAKKIDIPERTIAGYERGERMPSLEFLARLSTTLGVNANWFLTGKGNMFVAQEYQQVRAELADGVRSILREEGLIK